GSRFAQLIILPYARNLKVTEAKELAKSERGEKGFGSTGF
ncbi:dUTP diphosphatase, partial [archaeon]